MKGYRTLVMAALAMAGVLHGSAYAQFAEPGSLAVERNSKQGAVAARAPGRMVSDGVARATEAKNRLLTRPEITEDGSDQLSPLGQARVESLQIMFQSLNFLIGSLHNVMLAQAGRPPVQIPIIDFPESGGGNGDPVVQPLPGGVDIGDLIGDFLSN